MTAEHHPTSREEWLKRQRVIVARAEAGESQGGPRRRKPSLPRPNIASIDDDVPARPMCAGDARREAMQRAGLVGYRATEPVHCEPDESPPVVKLTAVERERMARAAEDERLRAYIREHEQDWPELVTLDRILPPSSSFTAGSGRDRKRVILSNMMRQCGWCSMTADTAHAWCREHDAERFAKLRAVDRAAILNGADAGPLFACRLRELAERLAWRAFRESLEALPAGAAVKLQVPSAVRHRAGKLAAELGFKALPGRGLWARPPAFDELVERSTADLAGMAQTVALGSPDARPAVSSPAIFRADRPETPAAPEKRTSGLRCGESATQPRRASG